MTTLFPRLGSPELEPYVIPFGRMMLAFGRAQEAISQLAMLEHSTEAEARIYTGGTADLPKRMRRLFRGKTNDDIFDKLDKAIISFKDIAERRHRLVHGEWWFNIFDDGELQIRRLHKGVTEFEDALSPEIIDEWSWQLTLIADEIDFIDAFIRMERKSSE